MKLEDDPVLELLNFFRRLRQYPREYDDVMKKLKKEELE